MLKETRIRIAEENGLAYTGIGEDGECIFVGDDVDWTNYTEACDAYELEHPYEEEEDHPSEDYPLGGSLERYDIERDRELTE